MKKLFFIFLFVFTFLISSCSNYLCKNTSNLTFSLNDRATSIIEDALTECKSFTEESEVKIIVTLLKREEEALKIEKIKKYNEEYNDEYVFKDIPFGDDYSINVDVIFNEGKILTGCSSNIALTQDITENNATVDLKPCYCSITYKMEDKILTSLKPTRYTIFGNSPLPTLSKFSKDNDCWVTEKGEEVTTLGRDAFYGDVILTPVWK